MFGSCQQLKCNDWFTFLSPGGTPPGQSSLQRLPNQSPWSERIKRTSSCFFHCYSLIKPMKDPLWAASVVFQTVREAFWVHEADGDMESGFVFWFKAAGPANQISAGCVVSRWKHTHLSQLRRRWTNKTGLLLKEGVSTTCSPLRSTSKRAAPRYNHRREGASLFNHVYSSYLSHHGERARISECVCVISGVCWKQVKQHGQWKLLSSIWMWGVGGRGSPLL